MATPQGDEQEATGAAAHGILSRYPTAIALGGGVAAAFGSSFIPMNAIEGFVTAYGIAELLPAAAPPLGDTARLALSAGIGTLTAGALLALLPRAESDDMGFETAIRKAEEAGKDTGQPVAPAAKSGKLAGWLRTLRFGKADAAPGTITDFSDLAAPRIRNGDQHPDAPARAPIRASADLGAPLDAGEPVPTEDADAPLELGADMTLASPVADVAPPTLRFSPPPPFAARSLAPSAPTEARDDFNAATDQVDPLVLEAPSGAPVVAEMQEVAETLGPVASASPVVGEQPLQVAPRAIEEDLARLSTGDLLARLEAGLARRRAIAASARALANTSEAAGRVIPLAKPAFSQGHAGDDAQGTMRTAGAFRVHPASLGDENAQAPDEPNSAPQSADSVPAGPTPEYAPLSRWDEDVEYLPPAIGGMNETSAGDDVSPASDHAEPAAASPDDDMDAALRDALATLRQLSDRQRGS